MPDDPPDELREFLGSFGTRIHQLNADQCLGLSFTQVLRVLQLFDPACTDLKAVTKGLLLPFGLLGGCPGIKSSTITRKSGGIGHRARASGEPMTQSLLQAVEACLDCTWMAAEIRYGRVVYRGADRRAVEASLATGAWPSSQDPRLLCVGSCRRTLAWVMRARSLDWKQGAIAEIWASDYSQILQVADARNIVEVCLRVIEKEIHEGVGLIGTLRSQLISIAEGLVKWDEFAKWIK